MVATVATVGSECSWSEIHFFASFVAKRDASGVQSNGVSEQQSAGSLQVNMWVKICS
jgi:hypothetical protein